MSHPANRAWRCVAGAHNFMYRCLLARGWRWATGCGLLFRILVPEEHGLHGGGGGGGVG